jgi:hypothetical protein
LGFRKNRCEIYIKYRALVLRKCKEATKKRNNWYYQINVENRCVLLTKVTFSAIIPKHRKG